MFNCGGENISLNEISTYTYTKFLVNKPGVQFWNSSVRGGGALDPIHNFEAHFCASRVMDFLCVKYRVMDTLGHFS